MTDTHPPNAPHPPEGFRPPHARRPPEAPHSPDAPMLLALRRVGVPALRLAVVLFPVAFALLALASYPIFANPATIGSDASNYYAAALRLNAGHPLYALSFGDRDVPIVAPYWSIPLLAPPPIAVLWRGLALLGDLSMQLWWLGSMVSVLATVAAFARRGSVSLLAGTILLSPALGLTAVSGNANAFLLTALVAAWLLRDRHPFAAGVIVAVAAAVKLSPVLLAAWFLARPGANGRRGFLGFVAGGAVIAIVSLAGAGFGNHVDYLVALRDPANGAPTPLSIPGMLVAMGLPGAVAGLSIPALVLGALAIAIRFRQNDRASFAILAVAAALATPVVYFQTIALLAVALAPWLRVSDGAAAWTRLAPLTRLRPAAIRPPAAQEWRSAASPEIVRDTAPPRRAAG